MKKVISLSIFLSLFFSLIAFGQNNGKKDKETGRTNLILPHGYVGLNTLHPTERLEVVGNVKVSNSIFAHDLDVIGLSTTTFTVREDATIGRNLFVQGNVGVGIQNPVEKMEIDGNLKVTQGIFSQSLTTEDFTGITGLFSGNLHVNQNFNVDGLTGLGIANPTERLEVSGNIKATQGVVSESMETNTFTGNEGTFTGNLNVNQNFILDGLLGVGISSPAEKVDVNGNIRASENLISSGVQSGTGQFSSNLSVGQNLIITGNTGFGVANPTEKLDISGNVKASGNILSESMETNTFTGNNGAFNSNLTVGQNLVTNGNIGIGVDSPSEKLEVIGNIKSSGNISGQSIDVVEFNSTHGAFSGNLSVGQTFSVAGLTGLGVETPSEKLDVDGNVKLTGILISGSVETGAFTGTEGAFSNNLAVGQNLNVEGLVGLGVAAPTEKLDVSGNIKASGSISAQSIRIDDFNSANGSFTGNLSVGQNFSVGGFTGLGIETPSEKLDVDGNVKLTGILMSGSVETGAVTATEGAFSDNLAIGQNLNVEGLLGLGVETPTEKLDVSGNIKASGTISAQSIQIEDFNSANGSFTGNLSVNGLTGLGVANPTEKLEVAGNIKATQNLMATQVNVADADITSNLSVGANATITGNLSASEGTFNGAVSMGNGLSVAGSSEFMGPVSVAELNILEDFNVQNNMTIDGLLGVNVSSPQATLHIGGDGIFDGEIRAVKLIVDELEVANLDLGNQSGDAARFDQDMYVEGNVGIGTEKVQGYKLSVNGKIRASDDIRVYPSVEWADYVFDENYELASLQEVEQHIRNNGRLSGMPSSEEVKTSGIELGEMDAKLLQKIEELTLYLLELKKENEKLSLEIDYLKQKVAE